MRDVLTIPVSHGPRVTLICNGSSKHKQITQKLYVVFLILIAVLQVHHYIHKSSSIFIGRIPFRLSNISIAARAYNIN